MPTIHNQKQFDRKLKEAMTVQDLIDFLEDIEDKSLPVVFTYNYGDYWKTQVAQPISEPQEGMVDYSDYHNMLKVVSDIDDEGLSEGIMQPNAVILK